MAALADDNSLRGLRNKALLQTAYFGAFRRSEVAALTVEELTWEPDGLTITLFRSKTDQEGEGIVKAIPYGEPGGICCPVTALKDWLTAANITAGPIFRRVTREGIVGTDPLYPGSINDILKSCATFAGLPYVPELSGHSLDGDWPPAHIAPAPTSRISSGKAAGVMTVRYRAISMKRVSLKRMRREVCCVGVLALSSNPSIELSRVEVN